MGRSGIRIRGMDNKEHPTNFALIAHTSSGSSSSSDSKVDSCSKSCVKAYATLKEQYDSLSSDYKKSQFNLVSYKADNALVENKKKLEKKRDELKLKLEKFQNSSKSLNNLLESQVIDKLKTGLGYYATSSTAASPVVESLVNSSEMLENQEYNKSKSDKGYHAVPLPCTGNFIPFKPNLTFRDEIVESENIDVITVVTPSNVKKVESNHKSADVKNNDDVVESKTVRKNNFRPPVIEDWNFDDDREVEFIPNVKDKTVRPSTEKIKFIKSAREKVEKVETPKQNKHYPRGNQRNWNNLMSQRLGSDFKMINKACFVCGSFEHLHYECDKKVIRPMWNNSSKMNHKNFANKMTHPHPNRRFIPQAVVTRSGKINTAGASVNTAVRLGRNDDNLMFDTGVLDEQEVEVEKKAIEVDESGVSDNDGKDEQATRSESERLIQKEMQNEHINSTNSINTVSTPVSTAGPSFANAAPSSSINAAGTPDSTANAFEEHLFERFSPLKNASTLLHVPNMSPIHDTGIFGNAYDDKDVEEEVDINNVVSSYTVPDAPFIKFLKDHPKDQVIEV
ncbi:hypothetical protein Tco_1132535 [Tanacetum coccineum]|uniref:Uncharacterized protein n=1 Tax=Tanacetum coccineum TaxID=301880 RepID=A0ABQ5JG99_9ASTR